MYCSWAGVLIYKHVSALQENAHSSLTDGRSQHAGIPNTECLRVQIMKCNYTICYSIIESILDGRPVLTEVSQSKHNC